LIQTTTTDAPQGHMYYIGLDVHKKTVSYSVKDASGQVHQEGQIGATRRKSRCCSLALSLIYPESKSFPHAHLCNRVLLSTWRWNA